MRVLKSQGIEDKSMTYRIHAMALQAASERIDDLAALAKEMAGMLAHDMVRCRMAARLVRCRCAWLSWGWWCQGLSATRFVDCLSRYSLGAWGVKKQAVANDVRPPPMRQARLHPLRATQSRLRGANGDEVAPW
jgi:hypothetical protein